MRRIGSAIFAHRVAIARDDRFHDDINVIALAADDIDIEMAFVCVQTFLESPFDNCERRIRRIEKIS